MGRGGEATGKGEQGGQERWPPPAHPVLGAAALLFTPRPDRWADDSLGSPHCQWPVQRGDSHQAQEGKVPLPAGSLHPPPPVLWVSPSRPLLRCPRKIQPCSGLPWQASLAVATKLEGGHWLVLTSFQDTRAKLQPKALWWTLETTELLLHKSPGAPVGAGADVHLG